MTIRPRTIAALAALAFAASGCTTGQVGVTPNANPANISADTLEFAVGTATMAQQNNEPFVGLNVVATFRQPNGEPATVSNTPALSGPTNFAAGVDTATPNQIYGLTPSTVLQASLLYEQFKFFGRYTQQIIGSFFTSLVGVFGYGFAPANIVGQTPNVTVFAGAANPYGDCVGIVPLIDIPTAGNFEGSQPEFNAVRYVALDLPVFSNQCPTGSAGGGRLVHPFKYYGGPPAWPSPQGFGIPNGFPGYPLGFTDFLTPPAAGKYTLSVSYPLNADASQVGKTTETATLPAASVQKPLPLFGEPVLRIQPDGSAFIDVTVPAGVTEAIVLASTTRCDFGIPASQTLPNQQYAIVTRHTGFQSLFLSSNLGPPDSSGHPLHTFCTAADTQQYGTASASYSLSAVGFDYPAFEASYPQSAAAAPAITNGDGHHGQADITTANPQVAVTYPLQ
jgi:hypothetical protein